MIQNLNKKPKLKPNEYYLKSEGDIPKKIIQTNKKLNYRY